MAYPWPGFGTFVFTREERPIHGSDTGWQRDHPNYDVAMPLGSSRDSVVLIAVGSARRSFECYLSPTRYTALEALLTTSAVFTDWSQPTPDSRQAVLMALSAIDQYVTMRCSDGVTRRRVQASLELLTQE